MSRWPWITTILSGLLILNPFGFTLLGSLFGYASAGLIAGLIFLVGGLRVLLGLIEWLTRTEIANARLQRAHEDRDGNA
jgi:hypothetical protein